MKHRMLSRLLFGAAAAMSLVGCVGGATGTWQADLANTLAQVLGSTFISWILSQVQPV